MVDAILNENVNKHLIEGQIYHLKICQNCGEEIKTFNPKLVVIINDRVFASLCKEECLLVYDSVWVRVGKKCSILTDNIFYNIYFPLIKEIIEGTKK